MVTIQQSIDINAPVHTAYSQLTQFEDYPRFMEDIETVQQIDDKHLHWKGVLADQFAEWDAEITEQEADRCIAWHNTSGPASVGRIEVQPAEAGASRVTFTLQSEPQQASDSQAGNHEEKIAHRLREDLARLKYFIEARGSATGDWRGEVHDAQATPRDRDEKTQGQSHAGDGAASASAYAAGSEGWSGDEDPASPVVSSSRAAAEQHDDSAGSVSPRQAPSSSGAGSDSPRVNASTQSDYSLSRSTDDDSADDGPFSVAEEVNLDQQSDAVRQVGQMPQDTDAEHRGGTAASDAMGRAMRQDARDAEREARLKPSLDRSVPPSE